MFHGGNTNLIRSKDLLLDEIAKVGRGFFMPAPLCSCVPWSSTRVSWHCLNTQTSSLKAPPTWIDSSLNWECAESSWTAPKMVSFCFFLVGLLLSSTSVSFWPISLFPFVAFWFPMLFSCCVDSGFLLFPSLFSALVSFWFLTCFFVASFKPNIETKETKAVSEIKTNMATKRLCHFLIPLHRESTRNTFLTWHSAAGGGRECPALRLILEVAGEW